MGKLDNLLRKIYNIESSILIEQSESASLSENEYYRFLDVISFNETFMDNDVLDDLYPETSFVVYESDESGELVSIIRQYEGNAIDSFCDYLDEFKYDVLSEEEVDKIRDELLQMI